jgi:hypothetical protein
VLVRIGAEYESMTVARHDGFLRAVRVSLNEFNRLRSVIIPFSMRDMSPL